jgi:hypothetical protein
MANHNHQDGNLGMALSLTDSIPRFCILSLPKVFASIPLAKIAGYPQVNLSPAATLALVRSLLESGDLNGSLTTSPSTNEPVLRLSHAPSEPTTELALYTALAAEVAAVKTLAQRVRLADDKVRTSKDFVAQIKRMQAEENIVRGSKERSGGPEAEGGETGFEDEDIMES